MINLQEVKWFGLVSMFMGAIIFIVTAFWDNMVGIQVVHHDGYGLGQILVMATSGIYTLWAYFIHLKWREYLKMVHGLNA